MAIYEERNYRNLVSSEGLIHYQVKISESDLWISSDVDLKEQAFNSLFIHRSCLESYIRHHPRFATSLVTLPQDDLAPPIVRTMLEKSRICKVGPMAGVAGAVSEFVGRDLLKYSENIIIENGGDIFMNSTKPLTIAVFAGESCLSFKIKFRVKPEKMPLGVCTSSASVGPSISFGIADAVCVISPSATLADAAASAIGNQVKCKKDIRKALDFGTKIPGVSGVLIICDNELGILGDIELV